MKTTLYLTLICFSASCGSRVVGQKDDASPPGSDAAAIADASPVEDPVAPPPACDYDDPSRTYVAKGPGACDAIRYTCEPGRVMFADECGCGCELSCAPQDVTLEGPCNAEFGVYFNGERCWSGSGCSCKGADCGRAFPSKLACRIAYSHCVEQELAFGSCVRSSGDSCARDADCTNGGCGGELCHNPAVSSGDSDCDCATPQGVACGCVAGKCHWWK